MNVLIAIVIAVVYLAGAVPAVSGEKGVEKGMTRAHNTIRAKLGLPGLTWSDDLARYAQHWADYLADRDGCHMQHRPLGSSPGYGENIFWASPVFVSNGSRRVQKIMAKNVVRAWAGEAANYDYRHNRCRPGKVCGHYTQIVWRNSARIGCGRAICSDKGQIWVCNYDPPGNFIGEKPY